MLRLLKSTKNPEKQSWLSRLSEGLKRTRQSLNSKLSHLVFGKQQIDHELLEELETVLLSADIGVEVTDKILRDLNEQVERHELTDPQYLLNALKIYLISCLEPYEKPLILDPTPFSVLLVGVNGVGKTTTLAKLAFYYQQKNLRVLLAAGDTFRAAAIEQIKIWGEKQKIPVIAQHQGADSASVIYDAMQATSARNYDLLIADTAGRLHTQDHLMDELSKIKRVMKRINSDAPNEVLLVIDAGMGQNALQQAEQFHQNLGVTGIVVTKLDGTAKGGIIFSITEKLKIPVRFIGIGEKIEDLRPFAAKEFVTALFEEENQAP